MSAIANNTASRRLPVLTPSMQEATEQDRFTAIRAVDLSEMPALAGVAKLFVLVAAPHGSEAGIALSQPSENELLPRSSDSAQIYSTLSKGR